MHLTLAIATKNNPMALATLLGSVATACTGFLSALTVSVCDASDAPVIYLPQMARLLAMFRFQYSHVQTDSATGLYVQRKRAIAQLAKHAPVLFLDDDHLIASPHYFLSLLARLPFVTDDKKALFGISVDTTNERAHPDYAQVSTEPSSHSFWLPSGWDKDAPPVHVPQLLDCAANMGHVCATAGRLRRVLDQAQAVADGGVADDLAAKFLAEDTGGWVLPAMQAWHLGNSNKNWKNENHKHAAVKGAYHAAQCLRGG